MSQPLLIAGGRIIDPGQGLDMFGDLLMADGSIAWLGRRGELVSGSYKVLDADGMVVCPGFVDMHTHLREPGFEAKETISTGTLAAARGGFTTVCAMPNTDPPTDSGEAVEHIKHRSAETGMVNVLVVGCVTNGRRGEELVNIERMAQAGAVALSDDGDPVADAELMRKALEVSRPFNLPIIDHCEDLSLSRGGTMNEGALAKELGLKGIPSAAEVNMVRRDIELAEITGGHVHIAHVSLAGSVELIRRAKDHGLRVTAEATPHHLTLTQARVKADDKGDCDTNAKVNPPLRTERDVRALIDGLKQGVIEAIATDHAPHTEADKACSFEEAAFGISGLETALGSLMALVHRGDINLLTLISKLTFEPARIIRKGGLGTLRVGAAADVTVFDPQAEWVVDPSRFASKGRNTPLAGEQLRGKVMATVYSGNIVYMDEAIKLETKVTK